MLNLYWSCLAGGVLFALVTALLGDVVSHVVGGWLDFLSSDFLRPTVIAGGITGFGGAGIILSEYTGLSTVPVALLSAVFAVMLSMLIYLVYIRPMRNSENSTSYSIHGFVGQMGEVITSIPAVGFGEILIKAGAGNTNQIAASFDHEEIASGVRVVVVLVKEDTLYVSSFEKTNKGV